VLYSEGFRRLGGVTQVALAGPSTVLHNRLTHSLKVEQVGVALFTKLSAVENLDGRADIHAVAAACLAHDLGHPPFGHAGEEELHRLVVCEQHRAHPRKYVDRLSDPCRECLLEDGFEGNAQSFRILTALAVHKDGNDTDEVLGLDLTAATLSAATKYPWAHGDNPAKLNKWGAYDCDVDVLNQIVGGSQRLSLDAQIMDWADDISYAVHDIEDFYRTAHIPLDQLKANSDSLAEFLEYAEDRVGVIGDELKKIIENLAFYFPDRRFAGKSKDFIELDMLRGTLLTRFINAAHVDGNDLDLDPVQKRLNSVVKQLIWYHVIDDPRLTNIQTGQRRVLREIFEMLLPQVRDTYRVSSSEEPDDSDLRRLPHELRAAVELSLRQQSKYSKAQRVTRGLLDYIAGLTDAQAYHEHSILKGREPVGHL
jgi:dGTPase